MEDNEWETIQPSSSASQSDEDDTGAVVLTTPTPVSPQPPQHDHIQEPVQETPSPPSSHSSSTTPFEIVERELPQPPEPTSLGIFSSWVLRIGYVVRSRIGVWSIVSAAAFVTVVAYARRWQRWRRRRLPEKDDTDKLLLLLNQKDEKIKQLLLQIDRMNETLSARRRVPVIRVAVSSPVVIGPRLN